MAQWLLTEHWDLVACIISPVPDEGLSGPGNALLWEAAILPNVVHTVGSFGDCDEGCCDVVLPDELREEEVFLFVELLNDEMVDMVELVVKEEVVGVSDDADNVVVGDWDVVSVLVVRNACFSHI